MLQILSAQKWLCSGHEPEEEEVKLEGFVDTVKELWNKMKSMSEYYGGGGC